MPHLPNHEAFTSLLQENYRRLFGYVLPLVQNLDDAQDILQDTCKTLWEKFDEYDCERPFLGWAIGIARYKALQHLERVARRGENVNTELVARLSEMWEQRKSDAGDDRVTALRGCVDKLESEPRNLLMSCYDGKRTVRQVADELGRPVSSVHNSLRRIRERLLACIERALAAEVSP